eukprot:scaffold28484_cov124-Isochrysis_galbana.AAC.1
MGAHTPREGGRPPSRSHPRWGGGPPHRGLRPRRRHVPPLFLRPRPQRLPRRATPRPHAYGAPSPGRYLTLRP